MLGTPRFTFGYKPLVQGVALIPALIGMFAFAQILSLMEKDEKYIAVYQQTRGLIGKVVSYFVGKCKIIFLRSSIIGTFIGIQIEKKLALGTSIIRVITQIDATALVNNLREEGFGVTYLDAKGKEGTVHIIYLTIRRCDFENVVDIIQKHNPKAFYTVEDASAVSKGIFPTKKHHFYSRPLLGPFRFWRKGK